MLKLFFWMLTEVTTYFIELNLLVGLNGRALFLRMVLLALAQVSLTFCPVLT